MTPEQWEHAFRQSAAKCRSRAADEDLRRDWPDGTLGLSVLAFALDALADEAGSFVITP